MPTSVWATVNCATTAPRPSTTHTACARAAQSRPTKYCMGTPWVKRSLPTREGPAERSSTGAPRRASQGATSCSVKVPRSLRGGGSHGSRRAADQRAVLGEAPEDLNFTLEDVDRWLNFLAPTTRGALMSYHDLAQRHRLRVPHPPPPAHGGDRLPVTTPIAAGAPFQSDRITVATPPCRRTGREFRTTMERIRFSIMT